MSERGVMAKRVAIALGAMGALFAGLWILLPAVLSLLLPAAEAGGWVVGPASVLRFAACTVLSAVTLPLLLRPIGREWRERDLAERGAVRDPFAKRPEARTALLLKGGLLGVVYLACAAFYFLSYSEVTASRYTIHSPLGTRSYSYARIEALEHAPPAGDRAERYAIRFDDGSFGYFGPDYEGVSPAEVRAIADHVSRRAGLAWVDAPRRP